MRLFLVLASVFTLVAACGGDDGGDATCEGICPAVVAADCANGPPNLAECISGCEAIIDMGCSAEIQAVLNCSDGKSFTCDENDSAVASGCESQNDALNTCMASS